MRENIFSKVFLWMFIGLLVSFGTGWYVFNNENMFYNVVDKWMIITIVELGLAFVFSLFINKLSTLWAKILYVLYSFTTGLTFAVIFAVYELSSIIYVFGITSFLFLVLAIYGYKTKKDLTKLSTILFVGLFGIVIAGIVNIFLNNTMMDLIITVVGIVVFMGFIAYDMQKIKEIIYSIEDPDKAGIIGAFELYLDFINLFIKLLRLFGKSKD